MFCTNNLSNLKEVLPLAYKYKFQHKYIYSPNKRSFRGPGAVGREWFPLPH